MTGTILSIFFGAAIAATIVVQYFDRKRERKWRAELLRPRIPLADADIVQLYRSDGATDAAVLRIVRFVARILHVPPGVLRPDDTIISLKAPHRSLADDVWALDDQLLEAQLANRELAAQTRTIGDVVKVIIAAEAKKGREVVM